MLAPALVLVGVVLVAAGTVLDLRHVAILNQTIVDEHDELVTMKAAAMAVGLEEQARAKLNVDLKAHLRALLTAYDAMQAKPAPTSTNPYVKMEELLQQSSSCR